jgi:hypothetical protein
LNSPLHHSLFLPPPIPGIVSTGLIFPFSHEYIFPHVYPPTPLQGLNYMKMVYPFEFI